MTHGASIAASVVASAALVSSAVRARRRTVSDREARLFHAVNARDGVVELPARAVMQAGSLGAVWVGAAAVEFRSSDRTRALTIAGTGTAVWIGAKAVKRLVGRGRPARHLDAVVIRGPRPTGLGYPSGHAAVATVLALLVADAGAARVLSLAVAGATGVARIHVGAHLPLDVVGGHALGVLAAMTAAGARRRTR